MKTALQTAIEKIDFAIQMWKDPSNEMDGLHTLETLKQDVINLLEAEKQIIETAFADGFVEGVATQASGEQYLSPETYYNETFNKS